LATAEDCEEEVCEEKAGLKTARKNVLKDAKVSKFRWHDMRHTFASRLVMKGVDINTVRELLGHADYQMTLRYAHLAPEHKADAVARLAAE
jgi:site-specific recombinase XerD